MQLCKKEQRIIYLEKFKQVTGKSSIMFTQLLLDRISLMRISLLL